jgi:hypothetical protein
MNKDSMFQPLVSFKEDLIEKCYKWVHKKENPQNSYGLRVTRDYELKKNLYIYTLISHDT